MDRGAEIREHLFSLAGRGVKYDLARMAAAASLCGNPQNACPCFHVAGTNGKGSVCAYLESVLRQCGHRTGLFTSPHLLRFEERFMINGRPIDENVWLEVYRDQQSVIDEFRLTFFEATTLMAFEIFRRRKVAWAVFETGLGGRLDATNVVVPRVAVISRIAMDHMAYLGGDLASIAAEKIGIVKPGIPLVMAEPESSEIRGLAIDKCKKTGTSCRFVARADAEDCVTDATGSSFTYGNMNIRINLRGEYQVVNALLAVNALAEAGINDGGAMARGFGRAWLPGRFQAMTIRNRTVVFDVGHNPDAVNALCGELQREFSGKSICFVVGVMKDKDSAAMVPRYAAVARRVIFTAPATERAARPEELRNKLPADFQGECRIAAVVASAIETAFASPEDVICIVGSFFTVGEAMGCLNVDPYGRYAEDRK